MSPSDLAPPLSPETFAILRSGYGVLLFLTFAMTLPQARRFFISERYRGYAQSSPWIDALQNPYLLHVIQAVWIASALALVLDYYSVFFGLVNLLLCRYFFIHMRWRGVLRGMGAPGFMTYWLGAAVFFLDYARSYAPGETLESAALLAFRLDFAFIMLSAGFYKLVAGYARNEGMELGMVNPWWGYWWRRYRNVSPRSPIFPLLNHLAYGTEIAAGLLMLVPVAPFQLLGASLIFVSFVFIATHIRLGFLCEMVMLSTFFFIAEGSAPDRFFGSWLGVRAPGPELPLFSPAAFNAILTAAFLTYAALLPLAHGGLFYNLLARRSLPRPFQTLLDRYANLFGIIIWRVFTADVIDFFVRIHLVEDGSGERREYTSFGDFDRASGLRYNHVGEFVCLASLFTALKYYRSRPAVFEERLRRYAATIPCPPGHHLLFEYFRIVKNPEGFDFIPVREFELEPGGRLSERALDERVDVRAPHPASPIFEGEKPGSYAPRPVGAVRSERPPSS